MTEQRHNDPPWEALAATEPQKQLILALGRQAGLTDYQTREIIHARAGGTPVPYITKAQASELIDEWKRRPPTNEDFLRAMGVPMLPGMEPQGGGR